ncbi:uncharacterized protein CC84DRAFT_1210689 [Paraphaeosphaeria sporulosa]|uniref:histidine kinase n=1 Tax=Paraphaeosphaeria sporulosa TaxID=1460663 RepID=A0A177BX07_9PLEO|nr:uncharacterized protein CC84DRAFT_1210689 [Paraphaeosphaeria sporulosa]OAF98849.1 hypothetical protein CC84DRAFT_1210689 [Paraphaeosphaeria sporulosa]
MAASSSACAQPGQAEDNRERVRAYEVAAYLSAASFPFEIADGPPLNPLPSRDLTLNALVQHGVHRMDCDRAFLSLIDNRNQFVCAEMTKSQPLDGGDLTQPLLLGASRIPLEWGVCPYTMSVFRGMPVDIPETPYIVADPSFFCIKDFRQIPLFARRPYVAGYPHMISYIEIPLRSLSGHIIGSYCVVDDKARDFLRPDALKTLREVTSAIGSYLNMKRMEGSRTRSERMMEGLRQFIEAKQEIASGRDTIEAIGYRTGPFDLGISKKTFPTSLPSSQTNILDSNQSLECPPSLIPLALQDVSLDTHGAMPNLSNATSLASPQGSSNHATGGRLEPQSPHQRDASRSLTSDLATRINNLFVAAANTAGHAMDLDGLAFFDAITTGDHSPGDSYLRPNADEEEPLATPLAEYRGDDTTRVQSAQQPRQSVIRRLTAEYPRGHLFVVDEHGVLDCESNRTANTDKHSREDLAASAQWDSLLNCIPNARIAIFLPLWHYQREVCFATCLAWVNVTAKTLDTGDLNSLTAFGNSLMAEVFRLEALTNTQAKSDFVSSISHELRSPLHGIQATTELIQGSIKDPVLLSLADMIESCSNTLLETFDHLLEFSNINSRARDAPLAEETTPTRGESTNVHKKKEAIDMRALVEDVVDAGSLRHLSDVGLNHGLTKKRREATGGREEPFPCDSVMITTNIENNHDWVICTDTESWKRILFNVVGNALKFTTSGHIEVALKMLEQTHADSPCISLSVTDTGIGMSPEFLKYHLFAPFMQENNLSSGTGLGLSIVKSIVDSLSGRIYVESRLHQGTRITVNVPFERESDSLSRLHVGRTLAQQDRLQGLSLGLLSIALPYSPVTEPILRIVSPPMVLLRSIRNICEGRIGMTVTDVSENVSPNVEVLVIDAHALLSADRLDYEINPSNFAPEATPRAIVFLGVPVKAIARRFGKGHAVCVNPPITGQKVLAGLLSALNEATPRGPKSAISSSIPVEEMTSPGLDQVYIEDLLGGNRYAMPQLKETNRSWSGELDQNTLGVTATTPQQPGSPKMTTHQTESTRQATSDSATSCRFKRLLLVDDNPINLKVLAAFATRLGLTFSTAADGAEAVRLYRTAVLEDADPYDCIFMDISMPIMNGFQAVRAIRDFEIQQGNLYSHEPGPERSKGTSPFRAYVFALTGLGSDASRNSARAAGFDKFLLKPVKFRDVVPLLSAIPAG